MFNAVEEYLIIQKVTKAFTKCYVQFRLFTEKVIFTKHLTVFNLTGNCGDDIKITRSYFFNSHINNKISFMRNTTQQYTPTDVY